MYRKKYRMRGMNFLCIINGRIVPVHITGFQVPVYVRTDILFNDIYLGNEETHFLDRP
jgi:hypothetical protein